MSLDQFDIFSSQKPTTKPRTDFARSIPGNTFNSEREPFDSTMRYIVCDHCRNLSSIAKDAPPHVIRSLTCVKCLRPLSISKKRKTS